MARSDGLTNYVKSQYVAEKLTKVGRTDPTDLSKQFELTIGCEKAKRGYTDLDSALAAIRVDSLFLRLPDDLRRKDDPSKNESDEKKKDDLDKPDDDYWYAFGRIAEQFGEREIAIADYRKLEKPKEPLAVPTSSYRLAQTRLKTLGANASEGK